MVQGFDVDAAHEGFTALLAAAASSQAGACGCPELLPPPPAAASMGLVPKWLLMGVRPRQQLPVDALCAGLFKQWLTSPAGPNRHRSAANLCTHPPSLSPIPWMQLRQSGCCTVALMWRRRRRMAGATRVCITPLAGAASKPCTHCWPGGLTRRQRMR